MSEGPNPATVVVGVFLILCGTCLLLFGGGCAISALNELASASRTYHDLALLVLGIAVLMLAAGAFMVWGGIRLLKPRDDGWDR